jgi:hypothetical protein
MPDQPVLDVGDFCFAVYGRNRRYRARVTGRQPPHLLIAHVSDNGDLVIDPDNTTRLFLCDGLTSARLHNGRPVAHLLPERKETPHAE